VISVACVGECMLELRHTDDHTLRLAFAGDTYNTAVYLRRVADRLGLAVDVGYLTGLGTDEYSNAMRAAWHEEGISDHAVVVADRVPGVYSIRTDADGERRFTYWRGESAARAALAEPGFWNALTGDLVHLSGITLQLVPPRAQAALIDALHRVRADGGRVSFDTNYRPAGWPSPADAARAFAAVCAETDIVLASQADEQLLHGRETPETTIRRLLAVGPCEVILRAGCDGAYVAIGDTIQHAPAERVDEVVDTTAAGDAASGAYLAARLAGHGLLGACRLANAVGAAVIQHPGALIPRNLTPATT
jgi:2-dehydro-3-deoxygluconokinase